MSLTQTVAQQPEAKPQDETAAGFHQSWFPLALAGELGCGQVMGRDFLGTRVILYRDAAGKACRAERLLPSPRRRSLGGPGGRWPDPLCLSPLALRLRGALCRHPRRRQDPAGARIATYPSAEAWGLIWAFNGEAPLFAVPRIPGAEERELICETHFRGTRATDPWVATSNGVDFQHLRTLHGLGAVDPEAVTVGAHHMEYRIEGARLRAGGPHHGGQHLLAASRLRRPGSLHAVQRRPHRAWPHHGLLHLRRARHRGGAAGAAATLDGLRGFVQRLIAEDAPVLDTIRFRPRVLVASDRHLARFSSTCASSRERSRRTPERHAQEPVRRRGRRVPDPALRGGSAPLRRPGARRVSMRQLADDAGL